MVKNNLMSLNQIMNIINDKANSSVDDAITNLYIRSTASGVTPVLTGETRNTTKKLFQNRKDVYEGAVAVYTNYSPNVYFGTKNIPAGGKTGTPRWTETTAGKIGMDNQIINGMRV